MLPYWFMFILPALAALHNKQISTGYVQPKRGASLSGVWWWVFIIMVLLIGYRFEVGGDWGNYLRRLETYRDKSLLEALITGDPGYHLIQWISLQLDWGIFGINITGAAIFSFGLIVFCRDLPRPWLSLAVSVPYLIIVVAMGYTRQGIAIGLAMIALVAMGRHSVRGFVIWVILAATFHKSAVLLLPIAALAATKRRTWTAVWISIVALGVYLTMLEKSVDSYYTNYILAEIHSQGALVRLLMNALPATILIFGRRHFQMSMAQMRLWTWCAIISLVLLGIYFVSPSSTAVDRVALLMLPMQVAVFSYVPDVFGSKGRANVAFTSVVLLYYATVQGVWLTFATHARSWLPYRFYPFEGLF